MCFAQGTIPFTFQISSRLVRTHFTTALRAWYSSPYASNVASLVFSLAHYQRMSLKWRRERDLNPRYTFVGIHTISSRAPSAARTSLHRKNYSLISIKNIVNLSIMAPHSEAGMTITNYILAERGGFEPPWELCGPQIDFESIPLRPLRYLSAF